MKLVKPEVVDVRKLIGAGNCKAFVDVRIEGIGVIKAFCVVNGKKGIFVAPPRKASKDGRWVDIIEFEAGMKAELDTIILEAYAKEVSS